MSDYLKSNPFFHDKVEFEVVDSCFDFSLEKKVKTQYKFLKSRKKYYIDCLKKHTENIIKNYKNDFNDISLI